MSSKIKYLSCCLLNIGYIKHYLFLCFQANDIGSYHINQ